MAVPANIDELLDLVRKSGVIEEAKLKAYLDRVAAAPAPRPEQPVKFATWMVRDGILTIFQAEQILQGKYKRFTIGKYKVLEKLGVGGMGQVFLCEHKMMRRRVAVKVLPLDKSKDDSSRERFYREARAVAALDHPNIVRAYDVDQEEDLHFLVMEYVDGTNLHDLLKKAGPLAVDRACHYIYASAAGLQYANGMGIIHRDIKPGNLLVDRAGIVKILDMGLAMFFKDDDESLTRKFDENVLGTADYLAPEQAIDSHTVDIRADMYSLGGTFYYLLTGSAPFPEGSIAQKLLMHQQKEPKAIQLIRPEVPDEVVAIVEKMMKKKPAERFQTPADLMAALGPYVQSPIPPPTDAEMPRLSRAAQGGAINASSIGRAPPSGALLTDSGAGYNVTSGQFAMLGSSGNLAAQIASAGPVAGVWEGIAAETSPGSSADTGPRSPKPKPRSSKRLPAAGTETTEKTGPNKKLLLAMIAVGLLVFVSVALYFVLRPKSGRAALPESIEIVALDADLAPPV